VSVFPDWRSFAVPQRRLATGCIPTGYEMILRAAGAQGIDFAAFQDQFDLDKVRQPHEPYRNNFESVAAAVQVRYPSVSFKVARFTRGDGASKLRFVEEHVSHKRPLLISLAQTPFGGGGWHIMPVVDMDDHTLTLLNIVRPDGNMQLQKLPKSELVRIHDNYPGGDDVAYLEIC
jgi:hypothetical protein